MKIINLTEQYEQSYFVCLEEWSDEMKEAGNHKQEWFRKMKDKDLGVKIALNDDDQAIGMIQYVPIEHSFAEGEDLYFINCIWVHGYKKQGVGNFQKQGVGKALLKAAEDDIKSRGAKGIAAWGIALPFFMKASWFKKQGYRKADSQGMQMLLWKAFTEEATPPQWIRMKKKPQTIPGKVVATAFLNGWCPAMNIVFERAQRAAAEFGDKVVFQAINTFDRETFLEWGISDGLFIDDKQVRTGPPPAYEKIRKLIDHKVRKLP